MSAIKQRGPFRVIIPDNFKRAICDLYRRDGIDRGVFFDAGGRAHVEQVRPTAQYSYLWQASKHVESTTTKAG